ncbi:ATP-binding protein [Amycolatopsis sp. WAC 01376]|uniref:ATP-binding protein n=1 Tax=Amycolatopsis sp. WAC 01376 TaxID=2203195 RepID=UPI000F7A2261|nr:ATP-binding protein [Amycolatopsis sp. WAC 01376]
MTDDVGPTFSEVYRSLRAFAQDEGAGRPDDKLIKFFRSDGRALCRALRINPEGELSATWKDVVQFLRVRILKLEVRPARQKLSIKDRAEQYRNAVTVCFNVSPEGVTDKIITKRRTKLAHSLDEKLRIAVSTCQKDFNHACRQIAAYLCPDDMTDVSLTELPQADAAKLSSYVRRTPLEEQFWQAAREMPQGVICFVGARGTGKSRLASELIEQAEAGGRDCLRLDGSSSRALYNSLARELSERDIHVDNNDDELVRTFISYINAPRNNKSVVFIDDVSAWETIESLVAARPTVLFVVTSNNGELRPSCAHRMIDVDVMRAEEATALARMLIEPTHATDDDCRQLADQLGYLPLAIDHAANLISDGWMPLRVFLDQLHINASVALGTGSELHRERSLTFIYAELLREQAARRPEALLALALIAQVFPKELPIELLQASHRTLFARYYGVPDVAPEYAFSLAFSELRRLRLIREEASGWMMHSLSHRLIGEQVKNYAHDAIVELLHNFSYLFNDVFIGSSIHGLTINLYCHMDCALARLDELSDAERRYARLGRVVIAMNKFDYIQGTALFQRKRLARVLELALRNRPRAEQAEVFNYVHSDIDLLDLLYADARSVYDNSGDAVGYADKTLSVIASMRTAAAPDDLERQVWMNFVEIDARLVGCVTPVPSKLAMDTMAMIKASPHTHNPIWLGEAFLRLAATEARCAYLNAAIGLYGFAQKQFELNPDNANCRNGAVYAMTAALRLMTLASVGSRWQLCRDAVQVFKSESNKWEGDAASPPILISINTTRKIGEAQELLNLTEVLKAMSYSHNPEIHGRYINNQSEWFEYQLERFDSGLLEILTNKRHQLRYDAVRHGDFATVAFQVNELLQQFKDTSDPEEMLHILLLRTKLHTLLAHGRLPLTLGEQFIGDLISFATIAQRYGLAQLTQEACIVAHFVLAASPEGNRGMLIAPLHEKDCPVPLAVEDAFPEPGLSTFTWYTRVLTGEAAPFGILVF